MKRISTATLSAIFALLSLASCAEEKDGLTRIRLNEVTHSVFYAPLYIADALGYFKDEKLKIDLSNGGGADNVMSAVLSGDADIGFCGPEAPLYVLIGGSSDVPTVFGQLTKRDGSFLISRKAEPDFKWTDLKGKEILAGRKGGVPAMTFEYVLNNHQMFDGKDVTLNFDVQFNLITSAFEGGTADYCTMFEPVASEYQAAGKGHIVASVGEASGEIPYTCFMTKSSWLKKHESETEGFLRAVTKGIKYVLENPASVSAPYLTAYFESTPVSSLQASLQRYKDIDAWVTTAAMTKDSFTRLQDVIDNAGELTRRVAFEDLINVTYAEKAYKAVYN